MKKLKKVNIVLIISVILIMCMTITSNADSGTNISSGSIFNAGNNFISHGKENATNVDASGLLEGVTNVASILTTIGAFILAIVTIILGIQYMTSPPQKQATLRSQMYGLLWAAVVIFGAYGIWSIGVKIVETF